jgi:hypothetical protein
MDRTTFYAMATLIVITAASLSAFLATFSQMALIYYRH